MMISVPAAPGPSWPCEPGISAGPKVLLSENLSDGSGRTL